MFTNTKFTLDIARNVSTIIKTFINIVAARHDTTIITVAARHEIVQSRHATTQQLYRRKIWGLKKKSNTSKISIKFLLPINKLYLYSHFCQANHE